MRLYLVLSVVAVALADLELANTNVTPFDSVDSDGNGKIEYNEFEKWHKQKLSEKDENVIKGRFSKYDTSHDESLDVSEFVPLAYEISQKPIDTTQEIFKKMDRNLDGIVDKKEIEEAKNTFDAGIIEGVLSIADMNKDGQLSFEEFQAQLMYNKPKSKAEEARETAAQLLAFIDSNGDQQLSAQEIFTFSNQFNKVVESDIAKVMSLLDKNNDNFLSLHELGRLPQSMTQLINIQTPPTI